MSYKQSFLRTLSTSTVLAVLLICPVFGLHAVAQQADQAQSPLPGARQPNNPDDWEAQQKREMVKQQNLQRQQEIKKDTAKLVELATELKQDVDKTNENVLSLDVVKKAEEIEKLAKSVKDKMKSQ